jgi:cytochrome P450
VRYKFPEPEFLLLSNADAVQEVLQSNKWISRPQEPYFAYCYSRITNKPNSYGLTMREGDDWKLHRRIANKALLTPKVVDSFAPAINRHSIKLVNKWKEADSGKKPVVVNADLSNFTAAVIISAGFGEAAVISEKTYQELVSCVKTFFAGYDAMCYLPQPYPDSPIKQKLDLALDQVKETARNLLKWKKAEIAKYGGVDGLLASGASVDFLTLMASTVDEVTGQTIPETEALADLLDVMNGGTDTTASLLCYGMYLLATHPQIQEQVYEEIIATVGKEKPIDAASLTSMKFLAQTVKEMQRVYPSAPLNGRTATDDAVVGGYRIPKGTSAVLNTWKIHLDERYFKNPRQFDPLRWNEKHHPFAWAPFGHGARSCIGMRLSLMESKIALAHIVRTFKIGYEESEPPKYVYGITLRPKNDVAFTLRPRN